MPETFDEIFDECVDRINHGETLEDCLASYPEHAKELESLLRAMLDTQRAYTFTPSPTTKSAARRRFNAALEELERRREARQPLFPRLFGWPKVWVTATVVVLIALIGYFGLRPILFPTGIIPELGPGPVVPSPQPGPTPVMPSPQPSPEGNFVFLISDEVNTIGDFSSLNVTISKIGLLPAGDSEQWAQFDPQVKGVDLTLVQGDETEEIWRGNVTEGQYTKIFIHVADVQGVLKETGQKVEVKLPSQKLQMSKSFQIAADTVTSFTYDLTVVDAGSPQSGIKYILKPQISESGTTYKPSDAKPSDGKPSDGKGKSGKPRQ